MTSLFESFLATAQTREAFADRQLIEAMLRFEAALARAQATLGIIPPASASTIVGTCKVELFDVDKLARESARSGSAAIALIRELKDMVGLFNPEAVAHVHLGTTSQDVIDTAMAMITRQALAHIATDVRQAIDTLLTLAERHAATPMLARTLMQPASVTSFGLKCAAWAASLQRGWQRVQASAGQALQLQLGGSVGTQAEMLGRGPEVAALMAHDLGLAMPQAPWQAHRDDWVALGCALGILAGSLGKLAKDLAMLGQHEVSEVSEPAEPGRGRSSSMPHKHNPVAAMVAMAAAQCTPHRIAALLAALPQEHERALGLWHAELAEWPQLLMSVHGSVHALARALPGLRIDPGRMSANLAAAAAHVPPDLARLWFDPALVCHAEALARQQLNAVRHGLEEPPTSTPP